MYGQKNKIGYAFSLNRSHWQNGTYSNTLIQEIGNRSDSIYGNVIPKSKNSHILGSVNYSINNKNIINVDFRAFNANGSVGRSLSRSNDNSIRSVNTSLNDFNYSLGGGWEFKYDSISSLVISVQRNDRRNGSNIASSDDFGTSFSDGKSVENIFQIDHKRRKVEFGGAATSRRLNAINGTDALKNDLKYEVNQNVFAAYISYKNKFKKLFHYEAGVRAEMATYLGRNKSSILGDSIFFDEENFRLFPTFSLNRQLKSSINMSFNYSLRIRRPQLYYLNPFINSSNPYSVTTGNMFLRPELSNNYEVVFTKTGKKYDFHSLTFSYQKTTNGILSYLIPYSDSVFSSYPINLQSQHIAGISEYSSFSVSKKVNIVISGNFYWTMYKGNVAEYEKQNNLEIKRNGIYGSTSLTVSGKIFKKVAWNIQNDYTLPQIYPQGKSSGFFYQDFSMSTAFFKNALRVWVAARQPFIKELNFKNTYLGDGFSQKTYNITPQRRLALGFTYSFGKQPKQNKTIRKKINPTDKKSGSEMDDIKKL